MSQGVKRTLLTSICINLWGAGQGDYISVQKDHTLSGCSCTFQSVSEALAEPACRVQVRLPLFTCLRGSYGHTLGLNACDQSVSGVMTGMRNFIHCCAVAVRSRNHRQRDDMLSCTTDQSCDRCGRRTKGSLSCTC